MWCCCTGIDYTHPAFGGCTAVNDPPGKCRVVAGKDLVGDVFVSGKDVQKPDNDPVSWLRLVIESSAGSGHIA